MPARRNSGPAPDPNALRRERDGKDWTPLPPEGRKGETPEWPVSLPDPSVAELEMWARLWKTPQALVWEADGTHDQVALYVRVYLEAAQPRAFAATRAQAVRLQNELMLTTPGLHSMRYFIGTRRGAAAQPAGAPQEARRALPKAAGEGSARSRLTIAPPPPEED